MHHCNSFCLKTPSREDNILASRKRSPDRIIGLAPHDYRTSGSSLFEVFEVLWYIPRYFPILAYGTILRHCCYSDVVWFLIHIFCHCEEQSNPCSDLYDYIFLNAESKEYCKMENYFDKTKIILSMLAAIIQKNSLHENLRNKRLSDNFKHRKMHERQPPTRWRKSRTHEGCGCMPL